MDTATLLMLFRREAEAVHAAHKAGSTRSPIKGAELMGKVIASFTAAGLTQADAFAAIREVCHDVARRA
jgi:hypothetical protein